MSEVRNARDMLDQAERAAIAGDLVSADELLRNAAGIQEAELGPLHPDLAKTLSNLGIVAEKTGRTDDAEAFYRRAAAIASASLPPDHPIVTDSRKNLEDFCRERGSPIDADAARPPAPVAPRIPLARHGIVPSLAWVAVSVVVLLAAALFLTRASAPRETPAPISTEAETPATLPANEPPLPPPVKPAPVEPAPPPAAAPRGRSRGGVTATRPASRRTAAAVSLATAQLCQTLSTSGTNWRCTPVGDSVSRTRIVLYTRVRSPRNTSVVHRWYRGNTLRQSAELAVRANPSEGYRTYSRFSLDTIGDWRVEVRSVDGDLLYEQRFAVR